MACGKKKEEDDGTRRPKNTPFKQQSLKSWTPLLTPKWVIITFMTFGLIFIPLGVVILTTTSSISELTMRYDNLPDCSDEGVSSGDNCCTDIDDDSFTLSQTTGLQNLWAHAAQPGCSVCMNGTDVDGLDCAKFLSERSCKTCINEGEECVDSDGNSNKARQCTMKFSAAEWGEGPVFAYYSLSSFYQNHRKYVKSKDDRQNKNTTSRFFSNSLASDESWYAPGWTNRADKISYLEKTMSDCGPDSSLKNSYNGEEYINYPCGLVSTTLFTDTIQMTHSTAGEMTLCECTTDEAGTETCETEGCWERENTAWASDKSSKFKNVVSDDFESTWVADNQVAAGADAVVYDPLSVCESDSVFNCWLHNLQQAQSAYSSVLRAPCAVPTHASAATVDTLPYCPGPADDEFIVWSRTSGLPWFKKLYRKIPAGIDGEYTVTVNDFFETRSFNSEKAVVLSKVSWIGGKNEFLAFAYIAVGAVSLICGVIFLLKHFISPRVLGDPKYINWKKN